MFLLWLLGNTKVKPRFLFYSGVLVTISFASHLVVMNLIFVYSNCIML